MNCLKSIIWAGNAAFFLLIGVIVGLVFVPFVTAVRKGESVLVEPRELSVLSLSEA
jgi:hypothetical protein